MDCKRDTISGCVIAAVGIVFLWQTTPFASDSGELGEVMLLPRVISTLLMLFGLLLAGGTVLGQKDSDAVTENRTGIFTSDLIMRLGLMALAGFVYAALFWLFGYLLATIMIAIPVCYLFGNRGWVSLMGLPILSAIFIYFLFFKTMGLYQAPAAIFSFF